MSDLTARLRHTIAQSPENIISIDVPDLIELCDRIGTLTALAKDALTERDDLQRKLDTIERLHKKSKWFTDECQRGECTREHEILDNIGMYHTDKYEWTCEECTDDDDDDPIWPCATIAIIDARSTTHPHLRPIADRLTQEAHQLVQQTKENDETTNERHQDRDYAIDELHGLRTADQHHRRISGTHQTLSSRGHGQ